jgi:N-acetylneuraminic acid mutarotase
MTFSFLLAECLTKALAITQLRVPSVDEALTCLRFRISLLDETIAQQEVTMVTRNLVRVVAVTTMMWASVDCQKAESPSGPSGSQWERIADFGGQPIRGSAAFTIGNRAYVVSGTTGNQLLPQVYQYDVSTNTWTRKSDFPGTSRLDCNGFAIGGKGYVCLGSDNVICLSDLWEYDPQTNGWMKKKDFPGAARLLATVLVINQKAYVVAGSSPSRMLKDVWEYDPQADQWTPKADFPGTARGSAAGFVIGSKGYLSTGTVAGTGYTPVRDFWEYDPQTDTWTSEADFPGAARGYAQAFSLGSTGYIGLGMVGLNPSGTQLTLVNDIWEFDPQTNAWTRKEDFPASGRAMAMSFVVGSSGFVGGGSDANTDNLRDFWKITP